MSSSGLGEAYGRLIDSVYTPWLPPAGAGAILDLGCGDGRFLSALAARGYSDLHGVDVDEAALEIARREAPGAALERVADLRQWLRAHPERFRAIIARQVVYYFPPGELTDWLAAMREALAPGGVLIIEAFNSAALSAHVIPEKDVGIRASYYDGAIRAGLGRAGFEVRAVFGDSVFVTGARSAALVVARRVWEALLRGIYAIERGFDPMNPTVFSKNFYVVARRPEGSSDR